MGSFAQLHPFVNLVFFLLVMGIAMVVSHPAVLLTGLVLSAVFALLCEGAERFRRQLAMVLPLMLFTAILNPLSSQEGTTVLFTFPWGKVCTLEAALFGLSTGLRLATVLFWFTGWNTVLTSDKFVFLFGRMVPALALVITMGLRFVPQLLRRLREVSQAQKCLRPDSRGLRHAGRVISIVITWALENALDTADSMKSRGYGLRPRTSFSPFRFGLRDVVALVVLGSSAGVVLAGGFAGALGWEFYPAMTGPMTPLTWLTTAAFVLLAAYPLILQAKEVLQWRASN